jgi:hypothetical protein
LCADPTVVLTESFYPPEPATAGFQAAKTINAQIYAGTKICDVSPDCTGIWGATVGSVSWNGAPSSPESGVCSGGGLGSSSTWTAVFTPTQAGKVYLNFAASITASDPDESFPIAGYLSATIDVLSPKQTGHWEFNGNLSGDEGQQPVTAEYVETVPSWNYEAIYVNNAFHPPILTFRATEADGSPNATRNQGTIRFWYKPDWSSSTGPGATAVLFQMDDLNIQINDLGTSLTF